MYANNSSTTNIQSWFISFDILNVICLILVIILALIFLFIIIFDKTCHTVPMILIANSCLAELVLAIDLFWMAVFTLDNDLKQQQYEDLFCKYRGYISYVTCFAQNYSYFLQAIYRYLTIVYPSRLFWQSKRVQIFLIIFSWIIAFICVFPQLFTGRIIYQVDDQMCQMSLELSFITVYNVVLLYLIPMNGTILIYFKLVRYVKQMNKNVTPANTLLRVERELKMIRRIVILVSMLITFGLTYAIFIFMSFFTQPPKYHFRIAYIFVNVSLVFILTALFKFTDPIKTSIMKITNRRPNVVIAILT
ncbi:unnamed protein product [Adineta steineri]|uniref:G-protein coupled receptors family 1 profile domain-containing protein n=1 Tax=Adineta steineri TaxID=433720 RepID=A0A813T2E8_9BILA|nr:unnamed protein product [Adineta steineri]CAF1465584.1 unnamed protein product [Adineta steineri]CAF1559602.1 unnamed protein product [Adineta steineri]CAF1634356.1 unnamed protein product [Adineta steineri]